MKLSELNKLSHPAVIPQKISELAELELFFKFVNLSLYCCRFLVTRIEIMSQDEVSEQADAVQISQGQILNITLLASEWKSSAGGLSTLNRELAIHLAQIQNMKVSLLVPEGACNDEDKSEARSFGISILDAKKCVGLDPLV